MQSHLHVDVTDIKIDFENLNSQHNEGGEME